MDSLPPAAMAYQPRLLVKIEARLRRVTDLEVVALTRALDVEVQALFIEVG